MRCVAASPAFSVAAARIRSAAVFTASTVWSRDTTIRPALDSASISSSSVLRGRSAAVSRASARATEGSDAPTAGSFSSSRRSVATPSRVSACSRFRSERCQTA